MLMRAPAPPFRRSRLLLVTVVCLAVVQLGVLVLAAMAGASERPLAAHVETPDGPQHHAHDPAACAACVALHLVGNAPQPASLPARLGAERSCPPLSAPVRPARAGRYAAASPRAPPVLS
jgi:hypothetical protein